MVHKTSYFPLTSLTQQIDEKMLQVNQPVAVIPGVSTKEQAHLKVAQITMRLLDNCYKSPIAQNFIG